MTEYQGHVEEIYAYESTCEQVHVFWSAEVVVVFFLRKWMEFLIFERKCHIGKVFIRVHVVSKVAFTVYAVVVVVSFLLRVSTACFIFFKNYLFFERIALTGVCGSIR